MLAYSQILEELRRHPKTWLVTGAAGFIGSNLVETLLKNGQKVIGLDNFITGKKSNLEDIRLCVGEQAWQNFQFIEGDIRSLETCQKICRGVDYVVHQAALGSVPRSIEDPGLFHASNVTGFLNMLTAARDNKVLRFVYASSSSVYGDDPELPKRESRIGEPLSPYALTKYTDELYASVFARNYGTASIGLRYFNVFGRRQDPEGAYAAVIPKWIAAMIQKVPVVIFGTGETSRDFCFVDNAVQANILAAVTQNASAIGQVYNVAFGATTTLNELFTKLRTCLEPHFSEVTHLKPQYQEFRKGDIMHSLADISKAKELLNYSPSHSLDQGLGEAIGWYLKDLVLA